MQAGGDFRAFCNALTRSLGQCRRLISPAGEAALNGISGFVCAMWAATAATAATAAGAEPPVWLEPTASQMSAVWANVAGGERRAVVYTGLLSLGARVDLGAADVWPGAHFGIAGLALQGQNVSPTAVGDAGIHLTSLTCGSLRAPPASWLRLRIVSNIAGVQTVRLFKAWYEQSLLDGAVRIKAGQLALDDDFMVLAPALTFLQSGFGTPQTEALNKPAPIYPLGALGLRVAVEPSDAWGVRLGAYDGDAGAEADHPYASDLALTADQGVILLSEVSRRGERTTVSMGGFAHLGRLRNFAIGAGASRWNGGRQRGLSSGYVSLAHTLGEWQGSTLTSFARVAIAGPRRLARVVGYADVGLVLARPGRGSARPT